MERILPKCTNSINKTHKKANTLKIKIVMVEHKLLIPKSMKKKMRTKKKITIHTSLITSKRRDNINKSSRKKVTVF